MAVPAHKTKYFIIESSNLQKKANTPLKKEKLYQIPTHKMSKEEVKTVIYRYIFGYYNTIRVNSFNPGGLPPSVYKKMCEGESAA